MKKLNVKEAYFLGLEIINEKTRAKWNLDGDIYYMTYGAFNHITKHFILSNGELCGYYYNIQSFDKLIFKTYEKDGLKFAKIYRAKTMLF